jgi:hypothetical protein
MVALDIVKASNARLPSSLTAVFVGATSGIGEYTLQAFVRHCAHPRAYIIGRNQDAADRIIRNAKAEKPNGEFMFIKSDVALMKNVDKVCEDIRKKEKHINLLVLSQGTLSTGITTEEGLEMAAALPMHSRTRCILNLLPLLQAAPIIRRVLTIFTGTKAGPIECEDLQLRGVRNLLKVRGQGSTTVTLLMEEMARRAPDVSFIHDFPGSVRGGAARGPGVMLFVMRNMGKILGPLFNIPDEESGERHLYLATSAQYPARSGGFDGVELEKGVSIAAGTDGKKASGVYIVDEQCEQGDAQQVQILEAERTKGRQEFVWKQCREDFIRITGKESLDG